MICADIYIPFVRSIYASRTNVEFSICILRRIKTYHLSVRNELKMRRLGVPYNNGNAVSSTNITGAVKDECIIKGNTKLSVAASKL
jgi:hypothetical protein